MNLFQLILIISSLIFVFGGIDLYKRKKFNFFHFIIFIVGGATILLFSLDNNLLNTFGRFFGLARGADLLVYISIIILFYFIFSLLNKNIKIENRYTNLTRILSIDKAIGKIDKSIDTVLIMPAYNEGLKTVDLIHQIVEQGYGLIFIDDGSKDRVLYDSIVQECIEKKLKNVVAIRHIQNLGQGGALQTGAEYVLQSLDFVQYVGHFDSDGQHRIQDLKNFLDAFQQDPSLDIVLGSRFLGSTINMPKSKEITLKIGIFFTWIVSGIKLTDTHNGYRLMKRETLKTMKITMNTMAHASEIIDIVNNKKLHYKEVPVTILYTAETISKGQKISNAIKIAKNLVYKKVFFK